PPRVEATPDPALANKQLTLAWQASDISGISQTIAAFCKGTGDLCEPSCHGSAWATAPGSTGNNQTYSATLDPIAYDQPYYFCLTLTDNAANSSLPLVSGPYLFSDAEPPPILSFIRVLH